MAIFRKENNTVQALQNPVMPKLPIQVGASFDKIIGGEKLPGMQELEASSMRLAEAALERDMRLQKLRGEQEIGLQQLRGGQEIGLQQLRGSQETGLQQLRGGQETGIQQLRGGQETALQRLRGNQEISALKTRASLEERAEIASEIRMLEREKANIGMNPFSPTNQSLLRNIQNQINRLRASL